MLLYIDSFGHNSKTNLFLKLLSNEKFSERKEEDDTIQEFNKQ